MTDEVAPIAAFMNHLMRELNKAGVGLNFTAKSDDFPSVVSHPVGQISPLLSEFTGTGMGGKAGRARFEDVATVALEIFSPRGGSAKEIQWPALKLDWKVKKWLAANLSKRPKEMPASTGFKQALIRRTDFENPYPEMKNIDYARIEIEVQLTETTNE